MNGKGRRREVPLIPDMSVVENSSEWVLFCSGLCSLMYCKGLPGAQCLLAYIYSCCEFFSICCFINMLVTAAQFFIFQPGIRIQFHVFHKLKLISPCEVKFMMVGQPKSEGFPVVPSLGWLKLLLQDKMPTWECFLVDSQMDVNSGWGTFSIFSRDLIAPASFWQDMATVMHM